MNKKYFFLILGVLVITTTVFFLTNRASNVGNYTAESENWRVSLKVDKSGKYFGSLSCEYIGEINKTINHFEYKLKGARDSISGSEKGNWDSGYKYSHGGISADSLVPNENDQFEITITFGENTEMLVLSR